MGIGGILGGLANISPAIQNGNLQGQIQGKEMNLQTQMELAKLAQQQMIAQSEKARNEAMGGYYQNLNQTKENVAQTGATARENVALTKGDFDTAIENLKADVAKRGQDVGLTESDKRLIGILAALNQRQNNFDISHGQQVGTAFASQNKQAMDDANALSQADAAIQSMKNGNPGAYKTAMVAFSRAVNGGQTVRQATTNFLGTIDNSLPGRIAQGGNLLFQGTPTGGQTADLSDVVHTMAENARGNYTRRYSAAKNTVQNDPASTLALSQYDPSVIFGQTGAPPPAIPQPGQYSSWNTLPKPPGQPNAPGAAATPVGNAPSN